MSSSLLSSELIVIWQLMNEREIVVKITFCLSSSCSTCTTESPSAETYKNEQREPQERERIFNITNRKKLIIFLTH